MYDIHIATEDSGHTEELQNQLYGLGFIDDTLAERGLTFDPRTAQYYTSCPLIDIHMSRKIEELPILKSIEHNADTLLRESGVPGYWHSEFIEQDEHVIKENEFSLQPFFCVPLAPRPHQTDKRWDIHVAIKEVSLPEELKQLLIHHGLYYLSRIKQNQVHAVFTVQGINKVSSGRQFYERLKTWLVLVGAPMFDIKFELTRAMKTHNDPHLVPPTIAEILYI